MNLGGYLYRRVCLDAFKSFDLKLQLPHHGLSQLVDFFVFAVEQILQLVLQQVRGLLRKLHKQSQGAFLVLVCLFGTVTQNASADIQAIIALLLTEQATVTLVEDLQNVPLDSLGTLAVDLQVVEVPLYQYGRGQLLHHHAEELQPLHFHHVCLLFCAPLHHDLHFRLKELCQPVSIRG